MATVDTIDAIQSVAGTEPVPSPLHVVDGIIVIPAFPGDPQNAPPSYRYFIAMVERLRNARPEDLTDNAVLSARPHA